MGALVGTFVGLVVGDGVGRLVGLFEGDGLSAGGSCRVTVDLLSNRPPAVVVVDSSSPGVRLPPVPHGRITNFPSKSSRSV